jgi:hypothetical protein
MSIDYLHKNINFVPNTNETSQIQISYHTKAVFTLWWGPEGSYH